MAGIQERGESLRILFRYRGKQHILTLGKVSEDEAKSGGLRSRTVRSNSLNCATVEKTQPDLLVRRSGGAEAERLSRRGRTARPGRPGPSRGSGSRAGCGADRGPTRSGKGRGCGSLA